MLKDMLYLYTEVLFMDKKISQELMSFIKKSPTAFHAIDNIKKTLLENGFEELLEGQVWKIETGKRYLFLEIILVSLL